MSHKYFAVLEVTISTIHVPLYQQSIPLFHMSPFVNMEKIGLFLVPNSMCSMSPFTLSARPSFTTKSFPVLYYFKQYLFLYVCQKCCNFFLSCHQHNSGYTIFDMQPQRFALYHHHSTDHHCVSICFTSCRTCAFTQHYQLGIQAENVVQNLLS